MLGIRGGEPDYLSLSGVFSMLSIGQKFPQFSLTGVVSSDLKNAFQPFTQDSFQGKWQVVFFWAQGLHVRVPNRDCRVRQARQGIQGP